MIFKEKLITLGVYKLKLGARIIDAINAAGGETEEADTSNINLAYILEDGVRLYIPRINEKIGSLEDTNYKSFISYESGIEGIITDTYTNNQEEIKENAKVNINRANLDKLKTLPGIGESTAQSIIKYREEHGRFNSIEELKNVSRHWHQQI